MNSVTVVITMYLNENDANNLKNKIPILNGINFLFLNNNTKIKLDWAVNNDFNGGKFWSIYNNISKINDKYFLVIDPDDIFEDTINWELLSELSIEIAMSNDFNLGVNSYFEIRENTFKVKNDDFNKVFNACSIHNTKNLMTVLNESGITWDGEMQTYYEDFLLAIASSVNGKTKFFDIPFYGYNYRKGISKNWKKHKLEIYNANKKMNKIIHKHGISNIDDLIKDRIISINIKRISERSKEWINEI